MTRQQIQVAEWMRLAGQDTPLLAQLTSGSTAELRDSLIEEESYELSNAMASGDLVEIADALGDLLYVVLGAAVAHGIDLEPVFEEVHRSNMSKFRPGFSKRPDGKLIKSPDYSPVNLKPILESQGAIL